MAKEFLSRRGVPYIEKDVSRDRAAAFEMMRKSGQQGVPQILVGDEIVVGFNRGRLESLLRQYEQAPGEGVSLGVRVADAAKHMPAVGQGAYVGYVTPASPAARAGLQPGDVIVSLDGRPVRGADDLIAIGKSLRRGRSVHAVIVRGDERRQVTLLA